MTASRTIRTLVVDDEELVRAGLRMILESTDDIVIVGEAHDGADAVDAVRRFRPDVVLMDIRMPRLDGLAATAAIRALDDSPRILILTTFHVDDHVFRALQAGADGFLLKDSPPRDLIDAIHVIAAGDAMLSPSVTRTLISRFTDGASIDSKRHAADQLLETLTPREREVLVELTLGLSNADIGSALFMSESTVKAHITRLFTKLGCSNRVQLAILARDADLA